VFLDQQYLKSSSPQRPSEVIASISAVFPRAIISEGFGKQTNYSIEIMLIYYQPKEIGFKNRNFKGFLLDKYSEKLPLDCSGQGCCISQSRGCNASQITESWNSMANFPAGASGAAGGRAGVDLADAH
jgi:hypothetical protein